MCPRSFLDEVVRNPVELGYPEWSPPTPVTAPPGRAGSLGQPLGSSTSNAAPGGGSSTFSSSPMGGPGPMGAAGAAGVAGAAAAGTGVQYGVEDGMGAAQYGVAGGSSSSSTTNGTYGSGYHTAGSYGQQQVLPPAAVGSGQVR